MRNIFLIFAMLFFTCLNAQVSTHTVQPKETVYGLSKQYNISQKQLKDANPFLYERELMIGDVLTIPSTDDKSDELPVVDVKDYEDDDFYYKVIQPKENLYRISKDFGLEKEVIISLNPSIEERGLQIGDVIRIPKKDKKKPTEEKVPEGMHKIKLGETVYSIAKSYGLEMADIYAVNKNLQTDDLKPGSYIKIPENKTVVIVENYFQHKVENDEPIFSIMRKYDVSLSDLIKLNPELKNGLVEGMMLKVPMEKGAIIEEAQKKIVINDNNHSDREINIVWIMPFFMNNQAAFKGERKVAQDFYMGGKIALNELMKKGKRVNIRVLDDQNNKQVLDSFLDSEEMIKVDAIIGPFYQEMIAYTAERLSETNIPIFSPFINGEALERFENVYLATPREKEAANIIIDEMAKDYNGSQTVYIVTTSQEESIAKYVQDRFLEKFPNANLILTKNTNDLTLKKNIETNENGEDIVNYSPILAVLASENNNLGTQFVDKIISQNTEAQKGYSLFFVSALDVFDVRNESKINKLKEIGFIYTATRMVNTFGENEKKIIQLFDETYCQKPNKYMALGYDVVYDVIDRMDKSGKISKFDARRAETRLSSKIGYQQIKNAKAKLNKELRIIRLGN